MKFEVGSHTVTSTGNQTIILNDDTIDITDVFFSIEDADDAGSCGWTDITTKYCRNIPYNDVTTSYAMRHYKNVGGTKTLILSLVVTATGFSTTGEFEINVDTKVGNPKLFFLVKGT